METLSHRRRDRHTPKGIIFVGVLVLLAMLLAACGGTSTGSSVPTPNPQTRQLLHPLT